MDYGDAIHLLERANEKFEFPVKRGIDLQSEHERCLTGKYAKKPVIAMNCPKAIKAFCMRLNDDGRTAATWWSVAPRELRLCAIPRSDTGDTAITWLVFPCSPAGRESSRR
jgi:hypothetical protein